MSANRDDFSDGEERMVVRVGEGQEDWCRQ